MAWMHARIPTSFLWGYLWEFIIYFLDVSFFNGIMKMRADEEGTHERLKALLRNAAEHLAALYTPEGSPLLPNVAAELERDIARLGLVIRQIKQVEEARRQRLEEQPESRPHAMVRLLARVVGIQGGH